MGGIRMTEKRFTYIKNSSISQYQSIPIQKIGKGKAFHCQGLVDELNKLWNENEQLKQFIQELTTKGTAKIHLANGSIYKVDAILSDFKGD